MRVAAIGDLHCRIQSADLMAELLEGVESEADVLVLAGDLTDNGLPEELEELLPVLSGIDLPIVSVLGNHDHESDQAPRLCEMLREQGIYVLDGTAVEIGDAGFVGSKGFAGGFGDLMIQPFGERVLKDFLQESLDEAVRVENALLKLLECDYRVGLLHYSPIRATLEGEPLELYPFLGSMRLENALDRHNVDVIFHGHAHHGSPQGMTRENIPVHNVSRFVQKPHTGKPYCVVDLAEARQASIPTRKPG